MKREEEWKEGGGVDVHSRGKSTKGATDIVGGHMRVHSRGLFACETYGRSVVEWRHFFYWMVFIENLRKRNQNEKGRSDRPSSKI